MQDLHPWHHRINFIMLHGTTIYIIMFWKGNHVICSPWFLLRPPLPRFTGHIYRAWPSSSKTNWKGFSASTATFKSVSVFFTTLLYPHESLVNLCSPSSWNPQLFLKKIVFIPRHNVSFESLNKIYAIFLKRINEPRPNELWKCCLRGFAGNIASRPV